MIDSGLYMYMYCNYKSIYYYRILATVLYKCINSLFNYINIIIITYNI